MEEQGAEEYLLDRGGKRGVMERKVVFRSSVARYGNVPSGVAGAQTSSIDSCAWCSEKATMMERVADCAGEVLRLIS